jgi:hypothetical protein
MQEIKLVLIVLNVISTLMLGFTTILSRKDGGSSAVMTFLTLISLSTLIYIVAI